MTGESPARLLRPLTGFVLLFALGVSVGAGVGVGTGVGVTLGVGDGLGDGGAVPVFKVHDVVGGNGAPHVCPNGVQNPTW